MFHESSDLSQPNYLAEYVILTDLTFGSLLEHDSHLSVSTLLTPITCFYKKHVFYDIYERVKHTRGHQVVQNVRIGHQVGKAQNLVTKLWINECLVIPS